MQQKWELYFVHYYTVTTLYLCILSIHVCEIINKILSCMLHGMAAEEMQHVASHYVYSGYFVPTDT